MRRGARNTPFTAVSLLVALAVALGLLALLLPTAARWLWGLGALVAAVAVVLVLRSERAAPLWLFLLAFLLLGLMLGVLV